MGGKPEVFTEFGPSGLTITYRLFVARWLVVVVMICDLRFLYPQAVGLKR